MTFWFNLLLIIGTLSFAELKQYSLLSHLKNKPSSFNVKTVPLFGMFISSLTSDSESDIHWAGCGDDMWTVCCITDSHLTGVHTSISQNNWWDLIHWSSYYDTIPLPLVGDGSSIWITRHTASQVCRATNSNRDITSSHFWIRNCNKEAVIIEPLQQKF